MLLVFPKLPRMRPDVNNSNGVCELGILAETHERWGIETIRQPVIAILVIFTVLEGGKGHVPASANYITQNVAASIEGIL